MKNCSSSHLLKRAVSLLFFTFIFACVAAAGRTAEAVCTNALAQEAEVVASQSHRFDWDEMYSAFVEYRGCDDGAIAEGFSDGVVRLLANEWQSLPRLQQLIGEDRAFEAFVLRHLDTTVHPNDLKRVISNASSCPQEQENICRRILAEAELTQAEMEGRLIQRH